MIAESAETATKGNETYIRFPTTEEAQKFFDDLHVTNSTLKDRIITIVFANQKDATVFHADLIKQFGEKQ